MKVQDIMTKDVVTVTGDTSVVEVAKKMTEKNVGSVVVVEGKRVRGLVTDRDIVTDVIGKGKNAQEVRAEEIMTENPMTCKPDQDLMTACTLVKEHKFRRAPVVDAQGNCVGVISMSDIALAAEPLIDAILQELGKSVREVKVNQPREKMEMLAGTR